MLEEMSGPGRRGSFSVPELRDLAVAYLNDYDEELTGHPEWAADSHWNLWMNDTDLNDALFVIALVGQDGLEFVCGRGTARAVRDFADNWIGDVGDLLREARSRLTVCRESVCVGRRAAENWLGRSLGLIV
jgi:hypothetical protein